jgi:hypothetical protein
MIDVIDGVLYQRTLRRENKVPLFAVVYQDYIPRYGLELSVGLGDGFYIECASLFVEGAQVGRLRLRPRDYILSFQDPEHKEMLDFLGRVVGFYKQETAKKFLVYGQLMRPLAFGAPSPMPVLSHAIDVGSEAQFPVLMSGVFRSDDAELGIFVVNASGHEQHFRAEWDPSRYDIPEGTAVKVDLFTPGGTSRQVFNEAKEIVPLTGSLPGRHMIMFRVKPTGRGGGENR